MRSHRANPGATVMSAAKQEVKALLKKLPDECTLEDIQYHLYVVEKIQHGIDAAEQHGALSQEEAEQRLAKWTTE
jgi:ribosomal protein S20